VPDVRVSLRGTGPEVLAAAADNDPTNVGTAAAVGAQTGYQLAWITILVAPLLAVVLAIAAHLGTVARDDLQSLARRRYGTGVAGLLLVSVVLVNMVTIAADLQAGSAGLGLLAGVDYRWLVAPLGLTVAGLLFAGKYDQVVRVLRFALLGFLGFGAAAFLARPDWTLVLRGSLIPELPASALAGGLALLGTTLTSYVYVWETIGRGTEETTDQARAPLAGSIAGSVITAVILWFMLVASAATLGRNAPGHPVTITSAQQAAAALKPLAGTAAADLFAAGLVVSAVVALPVLMATTAHVVGAQFDWRRGLSQGVGRARGFYAVLAASAGLAIAVTLSGVPVIAMLVTASILGGIATPIGLVIMALLARDPRVIGSRPVSRWLAFAAWAIAIVLGGLSLALALVQVT
jgi:Mn2+/Fe2+ NRAMP family transporter